MADKYPDFASLAASEIEGQDYVIQCENRGSHILLMAPHGGGIEPGTSEIALAIASSDLSFYTFDGIKSSGNSALHITSTRFDEPQALKIAANSDTVLTIHGERSNGEIVYLGGRNKELMSRLDIALKKAGFTTAKHSNPKLQGKSVDNICNKGALGSGVQLELGRGLRDALKCNKSLLEVFSQAVRESLLS